MSHISQGIIGTLFSLKGKQYERIDWKLEDFFSLSMVGGHYYQSPAFKFARHSWCLRLYANGFGNTEGWIMLYLEFKESAATSEHVHYTIGVKTTKRNLEAWYSDCRTFNKKHPFGSASAMFERLILLGRKLELAPSDCLTVTVIVSTECQLMVRDTKDTSVQTDVAQKRTKVAAKRNRSSKKKGTVDTSVQTDVVYKRAKVFDEGNQSSKKKGSEKVVEDMGILLASGDNSDVTVQVGEVQFKAHKNILAPRSPVLAAMFQHETAENISNEISISDCEPDIFKEYLRYIYTGSVEHITVQNVFSLHHVADRYLTYELTLQCLLYILDTLCVETFCDTVRLALLHGEAEMLRKAMDFASKNIGLIIRSVKWQNFIRDHPTEANEILIKSIEPPYEY